VRGVVIFSKKLAKIIQICSKKKIPQKFLLLFFKQNDKKNSKIFTTYHTHNISFHFGQLEFPFGILLNFPLFAEWNSWGHRDGDRESQALQLCARKGNCKLGS
jgi:hypothetical protein